MLSIKQQSAYMSQLADLKLGFAISLGSYQSQINKYQNQIGDYKGLIGNLQPKAIGSLKKRIWQSNLGSLDKAVRQKVVGDSLVARHSDQTCKVR